MNKMGENKVSNNNKNKNNNRNKNNNSTGKKKNNSYYKKSNYNKNQKRNYKKKSTATKKVFTPEVINLPKEKVEEIKEKIEYEDNVKEEPKEKVKELNDVKDNEKDKTSIISIQKKEDKIEISDVDKKIDSKINNNSDEKLNRKRYDSFVVLALLMVILVGLIAILKMSGKESLIIKNKVNVIQTKVINYDKNNKTIELVITPDNKQKACALGDDKNSLNYTDLINNQCHIITTIGKHKVYFKDKNDIVSDVINIDNYVVDYGVKDVNYLALGSSIDVVSSMVVVGKPVIELKVDDSILKVDSNKITGLSDGVSQVEYLVNGQSLKKIEVMVTNLITTMPKEFDTKKPYLTCNAFSQDEAATLDKILESRIADAGYGTRAGAVAAARFLTLEFPYKISYFWENGRLSGTGTHIVDGEGRYYHKGLYLDESKFSSLKEGARLTGPAIWGCDLKNYETDPPYFVSGRKYPNGLDCSGFVSWSLYNGGFDVGDIGAGDLPSDGQLTDVGDFRVLTDELIASGKIRVGDLFNIFGHISILVGEDEGNYYIAESLNTYRGVVLRKYAKTKVGNYFTHVVLMDEVYKEDGNLTSLWY